MADLSESLQVGPESMLSPVASPEAFGADIGASTRQLGYAQNRVYKDANQSAVVAAQNDLDAVVNKQLYDPKTGVLLHNSGEQAPGVVQNAKSTYAATVADLRGKLTNEDQKAQFDAATAQHSLHYDRTLAEYENHQVVTAQNANSMAFVKNRQDDVGRNPAPSIIDSSLAQQRQALIQAYARNTNGDADALTEAVAKGKAPEPLSDMLSKSASDTHMIAIETLSAQGQHAAAKAWFDGHKDDLDPAARVRALNMIREGSVADESLAAFRDIVAKSGPVDPKNVQTSAGPISLHDAGLAWQKDPAAFAESVRGNRGSAEPETPEAMRERMIADLEKRKITDAHLYDQIHSRIDAYAGELKKAATDYQAGIIEKGMAFAEDPANKGQPFPSDIFGQADLRTKRALLGYQKNQDTLGDDPVLVGQLVAMASDPQRLEEFRDTNLLYEKGNLSQDTFARLQKEQQTIAAKIDRRDSSLSQWQMSAERVTKICNEHGLSLPPMPKTPDRTDAKWTEYTAAAARQERLRQQVNTAVESRALALKRPLTPDEVDEEVSKQFATQTWTVPKEASFWDSIATPLTIPKYLLGYRDSTTEQRTGYAFEAPTPPKTLRVNDIPAATRAELITIANTAGHKEPTDALILAMYDARLAKAASNGR